MRNRPSDWYVPPDWLWHLATLIVILGIAVLSGLLLPIVSRLKMTNPTILYGLGVAVGLAGAGLLFFARLPLYREGRFWSIGPGPLDRKHRRFHWLAYACIAASLALLGITWLCVR